MNVAFMGDAHLLSPSVESMALFPAHAGCSSPRTGADRYLRLRSLHERYHNAAIERIAGWHERPDLFVSLGDITGGWGRQGLNHPSLISAARRAKARYGALSDAVGICWGDHDTGYGKQGAVNVESLLLCQDISPLFWSLEAGEMLFIGICSPLLKRGNQDIREAREIACDQADFVAESLRKGADRPWVLCSHNPMLGDLGRVVGPYAGTLERFVFGHLHADWAGVLQMLKGYAIPFGTFSSFLRRSAICPSIAPLFWKGGCFLSGEANGARLSLAVESVFAGASRGREESEYSSFSESVKWTLVGGVSEFFDDVLE